MSSPPVACPICSKQVKPSSINAHIDANCQAFHEEAVPAPTPKNGAKPSLPSRASTFFSTPAPKRTANLNAGGGAQALASSPLPDPRADTPSAKPPPSTDLPPTSGAKRPFDEDGVDKDAPQPDESPRAPRKKAKTLAHAPLAERMRPQTLDDVHGQALVGPDGVLRNLILADRVPSMILWGGPGTGKTTIARLIAHTAGTRFVEINSASSGVQECKKLFQDARNELGLTGRKTIVFCDEIHRFSKSQQDVFLGPVEAGTITLIGATTENPSFKIVNALLSRCRTFTLSKLQDEDVYNIMERALAREAQLPTPDASPVDDTQASTSTDATPTAYHLLTDEHHSLVHYLAAFADGDARTGLNLLELALDLCQKPSASIETVKKALTQTLVYDRAGDQHYDTISAFHKSVRGSDADAALYYLARMLQSGEDPLYIARRMMVIASEDVGLADNSMLGLASAAYHAAEKIGMPECRINLGHCAIALALAPKSVRAYRGLGAAFAALDEPGVAGLPVPVHLRNAPTKLMKELGYGKEYKYNPDFVGGRAMQDYLPERLEGRRFLDEKDIPGTQVDPEIAEMDLQIRHAEDLERPDVEAEAEEELLLGPDGD